MSWEVVPEEQLAESRDDINALATGTFDAEEVCDDCGFDFEVAVTVRKATDKGAAKSAVLSTKSSFEQLVRRWTEEMKAK